MQYYPPVLQTILRTGDVIYFVQDEQDRNNQAMASLQRLYDPALDNEAEENKRRNVRVVHTSHLTIPCRTTVITEEHPWRGKSVGPKGISLGDPNGLNIQLLAIDMAHEKITNLHRDTLLLQGDRAYYGCCHCEGDATVDHELCNCSAMDSKAKSTSLPLEFYRVPPSLDGSCFGDVLLPGATQALHLSYLEGVHIVAIAQSNSSPDPSVSGQACSSSGPSVKNSAMDSEAKSH